jgi:hypothetical protein
MNVLFDDGLYLDRALVHNPNDPYDQYSEAFQFYKPIDNIWGDFQTRDLEEEHFANHELDEKNTNIRDISARKVLFKNQYFLKQIPFISARNDPKPNDWQNLPIIEIDSLFSHEILGRDNVVGIAFSIYKKERVNTRKDNVVQNREITSSFYLALRLVTDNQKVGNDRLTQNERNSLSVKQIDCIDVSILIGESWDSREDLLLPEDDNKGLYRIAPTLVLNKQNILDNPNYNGKWEEGEYDKPLMFKSPPDGKKRMVMRIGRENDDKYILFLHGDQETGCPGRIPTD